MNSDNLSKIEKQNVDFFKRKIYEFVYFRTSLSLSVSRVKFLFLLPVVRCSEIVVYKSIDKQR